VRKLVLGTLLGTLIGSAAGGIGYVVVGALILGGNSFGIGRILFHPQDIGGSPVAIAIILLFGAAAGSVWGFSLAQASVRGERSEVAAAVAATREADMR
jgi:hypothetical protein